MKELDTEANEVLRLTAVLKKLLREMKEVPAEYKEIVKVSEDRTTISFYVQITHTQFYLCVSSILLFIRHSRMMVI